MKFKIGDHLQEIGSIANGRVKHFNCDVTNSNDVNWFNDEVLMPLEKWRELQLKELGI